MKITNFLKYFLRKKENEVSSLIEETNSFIFEETRFIKNKIEYRKLKQKNLKILLGTLVALVFVFGGIAAYSQYKLRGIAEAELLVDVPKEKQPRTGEEIVRALGRHVILPEGSPQIAEVKDAARLKVSQAFFENAENGDVVVVYESTIYLYRPSKDLVVAHGNITDLRQ